MPVKFNHCKFQANPQVTPYKSTSDHVSGFFYVLVQNRAKIFHFYCIGQIDYIFHCVCTVIVTPLDFVSCRTVLSFTSVIYYSTLARQNVIYLLNNPPPFPQVVSETGDFSIN